MNISNNQFLSIEQLQEQYLKQQKKIQPVKTSGGFSFEEILQKQQTGEIKFSKHAANRLNDRNIELTSEKVKRWNAKSRRKRYQGITGAGR